MLVNSLTPKCINAINLDGPFYILRGHKLYFPHTNVFLSLKIVFVIANRIDSDEMPHYHLGLHCLPKNAKSFSGFNCFAFGAPYEINTCTFGKYCIYIYTCHALRFERTGYFCDLNSECQSFVSYSSKYKYK